MNIVSLNEDRFVLGATTSILFDMSEADSCFRQYGRNGYQSYMKERINDLLPLNEGFEYAKDFSSRENHEVVLLSRNSPLTAVRAVRTMIHHGMVPSSFAFTNGGDPTRYLQAYQIDNFMSANKDDVQAAIARGHSACYIENPKRVDPSSIRFQKADVAFIPTELQQGTNVVALGKPPTKRQPYEHHIFDFDGVIAGLSSDNYFKENGLDLYRQFERANLSRPLEKGPLHNWLEKLSRNPNSYLTSICTIRGGWAAYRCLYDLAQKDIDLNGEFHATAGADKQPILNLLKSGYGLRTLFYDDRDKYVDQARNVGILAGQVTHPDEPKPKA